MKHLVRAIITIFCYFSLLLQAQATEFIIGVSTGYPPYYYEQDGKLTGICIELVNRIAEDLNLEVKYRTFPWKRLLSSAQKGEVDAIMPLFRTSEREKYLYFEGLELVLETNLFFTRKENAISYNGIFEEISPYRLGVIAEYSYGKAFDNYQHFRKVETKDEEHLLNMFKHRRFDIGVGSKYVIQFYASKAGVGDSISFLEPAITKEPLYLGLSRHRHHGDLALKLAKSLKIYKNTENYRKMLARHAMSDLLAPTSN